VTTPPDRLDLLAGAWASLAHRRRPLVGGPPRRAPADPSLAQTRWSPMLRRSTPKLLQADAPTAPVLQSSVRHAASSSRRDPDRARARRLPAAHQIAGPCTRW